MTSKILIVDDETSGIITLEAMLEGEGYEVESARSGETALEKAEQCRS